MYRDDTETPFDTCRAVKRLKNDYEETEIVDGLPPFGNGSGRPERSDLISGTVSTESVRTVVKPIIVRDYTQCVL